MILAGDFTQSTRAGDPTKNVSVIEIHAERSSRRKNSKRSLQVHASRHADRADVRSDSSWKSAFENKSDDEDSDDEDGDEDDDDDSDDDDEDSDKRFSNTRCLNTSASVSRSKQHLAVEVVSCSIFWLYRSLPKCFSWRKN
jgi:hypothetical protein